MNVSVIIPSYNQSSYLPDAIESALRQTHPCEVIVVDDGSTDNSLEIAKSYTHHQKYPVKVVRQSNKGLASARNTGIMNSTGEYILPLDADDILLEECVEKIERAVEETKCEVIAPSFKMFGVNNEEVILSGFPDLAALMQANYLPYFSAVKKSVMLEVGGYNPRMNIGYEDWDLWIDIFKRGHSLAVLQDVLVLYRTKETSMLTEAQKHHEELVNQMKKNHHELS